MSPQPVESIQTPMANMQVMVPSPPGGGTISLGRLIDFILQRTYHELTVLAELLPRKTDMERKIEIVQFASRTRQLFVRLLALVKWAGSASKVEKCAAIMAFLDKQSMLFVETADKLAKMARETLIQARLPSFHLPCAVEVLTLGTYSRLPVCIRDRIVPPDPITPYERRTTLLRLNQIIQYRLVSSDLPKQMRNLSIENGRVTFHVLHEFEVSLTLMGDGPHIPWRLLDIEILVEDKETGGGKSLVHPLQIMYLHQLIQSRLIDNQRPLHDVYNTLHAFCLSLQLDVLNSQVIRLCQVRLGDFIRIEEYIVGSKLVLSYWRELHSKDNQGYKLCIQIDGSDPSKPLQVSHTPQLSNKETLQTDQALKSDFLSIEKLLIHTVHVRTKLKLTELKNEIQKYLGSVECTISGSPAVLHIPVLYPCMQSEQLLIAVDTHTGCFLAHVPQCDPPFIDDIQDMLNKDLAKLDKLLSDLRYWLTLRRCEKTVQHLPALILEDLPLSIPEGHQLSTLGKPRIYVRLCRHPLTYVVVIMQEKEENRCEVSLTYYLMMVQPKAMDDEPSEQQRREEATFPDQELSKPYFHVSNLFPLDTFAITHGPCTSVETSGDQIQRRKRKSNQRLETPVAKKLKLSCFFISELAHIIAMTDERIPFATLTAELDSRGICHQGVQVEANGTNYVVRIVQLPPCEGCSPETSAALHAALLSCSLRLQGKGSRAWIVEFVFCNCPLASQSAKEQGPRRPVCFMYDFAASTAAQVTQMVEETLQDWSTMGHLYSIVLDFAEALKRDQHVLSNIMDIKSFTYKKLVIGYGPNKAFTVTIYWRPSERRFHLAFGVVGTGVSASNPHTLIAFQLQHEFNYHHNVATLIQILHDTFNPLLSITKLPSVPQLGVVHSRPQVPIQTFVIIPQSSTHIRIAYRNLYCLDIHCRSEGLIAIRDGAYSVFDKGKVVEEFTPIQGLKAFLNKFVDDTATQVRRRSQSEDDNPPSPVPTLDPLDSFIPGQLKPSSPAQRGGLDSAGSGGASGLRFHHPMTPPSGSNPHTPASPHTSMLSQTSYGASPTPSFSLASPPSLGSQTQQQPQHITQSPSMLLRQAQSPGNLFAADSPVNPLHVPSPSFLPTPSPSSSAASQVHMQSPAPFMGSQAHGEGGSPFPAPSSSAGSLSMSSPAPGAWPGSPSVPRPSPQSRSMGTAHSPVSTTHPALHSPQNVAVGDHAKPAAASSRVLPQRSWAAAIPTLLSHKAFDLLCSPSPHPLGGPPCPSMPTIVPAHYSPLERFLGCVCMRRNLHRTIQNDDNLTLVHSSEPGVIQFRAETMQCKVSLNPTTLQSLHLKLTPIPECKDQWAPEELQVLERFFDTKVVSAPFKPNAFLAFGRILNAPLRIQKDCMHIMRLELAPDRSMKWAVQWCLTIPPAAPPIAPPGMSAVVMLKNKMLFFLQLTRIGLNLPAGAEPQTVAVPIVYDMTPNLTQVADRTRQDLSSLSPTSPISVIANVLKRFAEYNPQLGECSIYPAVREILTNLVIPI